MKQLLLVFLCGFFLLPTGWAQGEFGRPLPQTGVRSIKTPTALVALISEGPLLLLGSQETDWSSLVVDPAEVTVVKVYRDSAILAPLGYKARNGVMLIELKNKKSLLQLEDVLDYFEVPQTQRQLRVLVNKRPISRQRFLADLKRIKKIEVITLDKITPSRISWDENEQFLNIVTVQPEQP